MGEHEFEAAGPETTVRAQFSEFKDLVRLVESRKPSKTQAKPRAFSEAEPFNMPDPALAEAFSVDTQSRRLSLRIPQEAKDAGTALLALMYGYRRILNMADIPVTHLSDDMKESGLTRFSRLDRVYNPLQREGLATSIGRGKGTKYRITNKGAQQAQDWIQKALSKIGHAPQSAHTHTSSALVKSQDPTPN
ncbi:MAG: hypothetical protein WC881_04845 [Elusimicrobiota bacterium]